MRVRACVRVCACVCVRACVRAECHAFVVVHNVQCREFVLFFTEYSPIREPLLSVSLQTVLRLTKETETCKHPNEMTDFDLIAVTVNYVN